MMMQASAQENGGASSDDVLKATITEPEKKADSIMGAGGTTQMLPGNSGMERQGTGKGNINYASKVPETYTVKDGVKTPTSNLPGEGDPNSTGILYNPDGTVKQERVYGPDGEPLLDTDWNHGGVGHEFPHRHEWKDGARQDGIPFQGPPPKPAPEIRDTTTKAAKTTGGIVVGGYIAWKAVKTAAGWLLGGPFGAAAGAALP